MGRKYRNPPLIEAVCEFQFEADANWDIAVPGIISERLKGMFPVRRQGKFVSVKLAPGVGTELIGSDRLILFRKDEKAFVQVAPNMLAVNHLRPYPSWEEFLPLIRQGLEAYTAVAEPRGIHRIGLRYINRVDLPDARVELNEYFNVYPTIGPGIPQDFALFNVEVHIPYEDERDLIKVQLASAVSENPSNLTAILDLDYFLVKPGEIPITEALDWVIQAHKHVEDVFEASITDKLRQTFEEV